MSSQTVAIVAQAQPPAPRARRGRAEPPALRQRTLLRNSRVARDGRGNTREDLTASSA